MNNVAMRVSRALEKFAKWKGEMFVSPYLKGRGPFIDREVVE
jgi:hypothetical protein